MKRTGRVYNQMVITYILVLCIPILLSSVLYQYTYNTVQKQSQYQNNNLLETIKNSSDREVSYYKSALQQLKLDNDVQMLAAGGTVAMSEQAWLAHKVQETMSTMLVSMLDYTKYCRDIFIYFAEKNDVIGSASKSDFEDYAGIIMGMEAEASEQLKARMIDLDQRTMLAVEIGKEEFILLLEPVKGKSGRSLHTVIGIWIRPEVFEKQIKSIEESGGIEWAFVSDDGQWLYATDGLKESDWDRKSEIEREEKVNIGNDKYQIQFLDSEVYGGKYILFSSMRQISQSADRIRNVHLLCMFVSVLLGYLVMKVSVKKNYNSVERLLSLLPKRVEDESNRDEFQHLEKRLSGLLERYKEVCEEMRKNTRAVRELAFERLLFPQDGKGRDETEYMKELCEKFKSGINGVLVFCIREGLTEESIKESSRMDNSLKRFIVANVLAEGVGETYTQETMEYDEHVIMIVNFPEEGDEENLQKLCDKYCGYVEENFKFRINTFAGNGYKGIKGIHHSYIEACQAESFGMDSDEDFISYSQISDYTDRKYQYSFETEEAVINAVRNQNTMLACSLIDIALEKNYDNKDKTLFQCMLYDIYTTLIKVSEEMEVSINQMPLISQAFTKNTLPELQEWFHGVVEGICNQKKNCDETKRQELYQDILVYIAENFKNPDLNITHIAMELQMSSIYMSSVFKKQTGRSILEVIRQMRVEHAKELLIQGMSVAEVSEAVGFRESSSFIRAFKNRYGVTPGQAKKLT